MGAASDLFTKHCLLQFEDFNSNDAFPLLAAHRDQFLTYNDDIQVRLNPRPHPHPNPNPNPNPLTPTL